MYEYGRYDLMFLEWAGLKMLSQQGGECEIELVPEDHHRGGGGTDAVHGGVTSYMLDAVMAGAVQSTYEDKGTESVTITLNIIYQNMVKGHRVTAKGRVTKRGKSIAYAEGTIYDEQGVPCVQGTGVFRIFPSRSL
jgi:uncharacterized protein (TIGR00369 family)